MQFRVLKLRFTLQANAVPKPRSSQSYGYIKCYKQKFYALAQDAKSFSLRGNTVPLVKAGWKCLKYLPLLFIDSTKEVQRCRRELPRIQAR